METDIKLDARAAVSTYIVFGLILGFICGIPIGLSRDLRIDALFSLVFVLVVVWIRMFRVIVEGTTLSYISMFGGKQSVSLSEVVSVRTEIGVKSAFGPTYRLVLEHTGSIEKPRIVINMKIFRREDMARLIGILGDKMDGHPRLSIFESRNS